MKLPYTMTRAMSVNGVSVTYSCYNLKLRWGRKCPDRNTDKCYRCKYCKAEMPAADATKCIEALRKQLAEQG